MTVTIQFRGGEAVLVEKRDELFYPQVQGGRARRHTDRPAAALLTPPEGAAHPTRGALYPLGANPATIHASRSLVTRPVGDLLGATHDKRF